MAFIGAARFYELPGVDSMKLYSPDLGLVVLL